jgi:hypothetical protein
MPAAEYVAVVSKTFIDLRVQNETAGADTNRIEARSLTRRHRDTGSSPIARDAVRKVFIQQFCPQATIGQGADEDPCPNSASEP